MQKTLGGPRLGSGQKQEIDMHGYERSTHNLSRLFRTTMSCGTLVPFLKLTGLPGDTFDIDLNSDCKTLPTNGPLFGSFKLQYDIFVTPMRLYNGVMHNNVLNVGLNIQRIKIPQIEFTALKQTGATADLDTYPFAYCFGGCKSCFL